MKSQIIYIVMIIIFFTMNLQTSHSSPARNPSYFVRRFAEDALDAENDVSDSQTETTPTISPESKTEAIKELEKLIKTAEGKQSEEFYDKSCSTDICKKLRKENTLILQDEILRNTMLKPAYLCDEWNQVERTCYLNRNVGNSVTFVLATPPPETAGRISIEWRQEFAFLVPRLNRTFYTINPRDPPWNIVIGSKGHELRISPITETDLLENRFTAVVHFQNGNPMKRLHFAIRPIVINIGSVYPGATMTLHVPSFISLPSEGMTFQWELHRNSTKVPTTLPSNMRPSPSGASLSISELRKEQEGVILCSIYSNLGVHAARVGFHIVGVDTDNNKLVFIATRPPHKSIHRKKRSNNLEDIPDYFIDSTGSNQEDTTYNTDDLLKIQIRNHPLISRYLKKLQDIETSSTAVQDYDPLLEQVEYKEDFDETSSIGSLSHLNLDNRKKKRNFDGDFDDPMISRFLRNRQEVEASSTAIQDYDLLIEQGEYKEDSDEISSIGSINHLNLGNQKKKRNFNDDFDHPQASRYLRNRQEVEASSIAIQDYDKMEGYGQYKNDFDALATSDSSLNTATQKQKRSYIGYFDEDEMKRFEEEVEENETPKPQSTRLLSLLEIQKHNILTRPHGDDGDIRQFKTISNKRLDSATELLEILVDVEEDTSLPLLQERDKFSMLIGKCERDSECSLNAECVKRKKGKPGFCRCLTKFEGNGFFCWEGGKWLI